ncbi:MAG: hypothetical protein ACREP9_10420, partial [Candidatus Dormibacteraceae bacterium]
MGLIAEAYPPTEGGTPWEFIGETNVLCAKRDRRQRVWKFKDSRELRGCEHRHHRTHIALLDEFADNLK